MTDALVHRLETLIRETCCWHHAVDPPDREAYAMLMRHLADIRPSIAREDALRLEVMIERGTGVKR